MSSDKDKPKVKVIPADTELQRKIGTGVVDPKKVNMAQQIIEANQVDFEPLARGLIQQLDTALERARHGITTGVAAVEPIVQPVMNLKANASTFNHPLISEMASSVLTLLDYTRKVDEDILAIVENMQKAATIMVAQKLSGRDNPIGQKLAAEFKAVCERYMQKAK